MTYYLPIVIIILSPILIGLVSYLFLRKQIKNHTRLHLWTAIIFMSVAMIQFIFIRSKQEGRPVHAVVDFDNKGQTVIIKGPAIKKEDETQAPSRTYIQENVKSKKERLDHLHSLRESGEISEEDYQKALRFIQSTKK